MRLKRIFYWHKALIKIYLILSLSITSTILAICRLENTLANEKHSTSVRTLRKYAAAVGKKMELHLI
jgi:hypothetical protein